MEMPQSSRNCKKFYIFHIVKAIVFLYNDRVNRTIGAFLWHLGIGKDKKEILPCDKNYPKSLSAFCLLL